MVDISDYLFNLLKTIAPVKQEFPDENAKLPLITMVETKNSPLGLKTDKNKENFSSIMFQIDVWANKTKICNELAIEINNLLYKNGYKRVTAHNEVDPVTKFKRKIMIYGISVTEIN